MAEDTTTTGALTDEDFNREDEFVKGLPRINVAALFLPPIWGFGHGMWATILFYPIWLYADDMLFSAYQNPSVMSITLALIVLVSLTAATIIFAIVSQPLAAHRAENRGVDRATYLHREHNWAIGCVIGGVALLIAATIYNLLIRPSLGI